MNINQQLNKKYRVTAKPRKGDIDGILNGLGVSDVPMSQEVLEAYGDSHGLDVRNLSFMSSKPVKGSVLIKLMAAIVPGYNDFEGSRHPKDVVDVFGEDSKYYPAREGSVCIYVKPYRNVWLDKIESIQADEKMWDYKHGMFRFWWD